MNIMAMVVSEKKNEPCGLLDIDKVGKCLRLGYSATQKYELKVVDTSLK